MLCINTMYKVADVIELRCILFFLYIADVIGRVIIGVGMIRVALLGTRYIME